MKLPTKVRSTYGAPVERVIEWSDDESHPYFVLEGWIARVTPHGTFIQPVNRRGAPVGQVKVHENLASALVVLGWEVIG